MKLTPLPRAPIHLGLPMVGLKHVRAIADGLAVADMAPPFMVWERHRYPWYFTPIDTIHGELIAAGAGETSRSLGVCEEFDVRLPTGRVLERAVRRYPEADNETVRGCVTFLWDAFDQWLEEDEVVTVHARCPYTRVDTLWSSRHITVRLGDTLLADSHRPLILMETGLPPRFYLPRSDVRLDLLRPTDTVSHCPYKGSATYFSIVLGDTVLEDAVWTYERPLREVITIAGLVSFWPEAARDLQIEVDGERLGAK